MRRFLCASGLAFLSFTMSGWAAAETPLAVVAAENVYGDVARQIGGPHVTVTSIISTPGQDPHQFEATPSAARVIAGARIVILNGAGYDPWIEKLLAATSDARRSVIVAADVMNKKPGDNPHLWYDPATMPAVATRVANALSERDPANRDDYARRLKAFDESLAPINEAIRAINAKYAGTPVTATEPLFGCMAQALGLAMRDERFQLAVMNQTEPRVSDVAAIENEIRSRHVRSLFYNTQVSSDLTARLRELARAAGVAVIGVTETLPADKT